MQNFSTRLTKRRLIACVLLAALQIQAANAGFNGELDAMWNTTQAQAYSNGQGMGIFGGSASIRTPVRTFNLISFDPPRMEYGCAGIDVQFGSFSMLNGEQIKTLTRAVVQSASVYLVHLAIASLCKECENQLSKFMKMVQDLSSSAKNTCTLGKQLGSIISGDVGATAAAKSGESTLAAVEAAAAVAKGTLTDNFSSWWDQYSKGSTSQRGNSENDSTAYGNLLTNSMVTTGGFKYMNTQTLGGDAGAMSLLMSVFGTEVIATADQLSAGVNNGTGAQSQTTSSASSVPDRDLHQSLIRLSAIRNGAIEASPPLVRVCREFDATKPKTCQKIDQKPMVFPGVYSYVLEMVAGKQPSANGVFIGVQDGSIAKQIQQGKSLSPTQLTFLRAFSINGGILLAEASGTSGSTYESMVERIVNLMADEMTVAIGRAMVRSVNASFPDSTIANETNTMALPMPVWMQKNVKDFESQLNDFLPESGWALLQKQVDILNSLSSVKRFAAPNLSANGR